MNVTQHIERAAKLFPVRMAVLDAVIKQLGDVPCYVQRVEETLPTKRITSVWKAR